MHPAAGPTHALPQRLRELRDETWAERPITQAQLAEAFAAERSTSVPLISSWESTTKPKLPPAARLAAYARFFATERSVADGECRLLKLDDLTESEHRRYEELLDELTTLWQVEAGLPVSTEATAAPATTDLWRFPEHRDVLIVCARLPQELLSPMGSYTQREHPDYIDLYTYADPDALIEIYGHLRATNPDSSVRFTTADKLQRDDYTKHLILLGGIDWNPLTRELFERVRVPVRQETRLGTTDEQSYFEATDGEQPRMFTSVIRGNVLVEDVAHFYRGQNPFNVERTVTICNGMYGRGTYGAVRALTDAKFRERNEKYIRPQLDRHGAMSLLMRVQIFNGEVLTPDWTIHGTRLHEWPEATT
jgi:hypothetical protein